MEKTDKVCVLVVSCDRYRDLWGPFFTLFFRYWPDCPYQVYLCANELVYADTRVRTVVSGPDSSWSSSLKRCLEQIPAPHLILLQEDFLLTRRVDTRKLVHLVECLKLRGAACLRVMPSPAPETVCADDPELGEIARGADYRISLQAAIWDKEVLSGLLREVESPWELENIGSRRSDTLAQPFLSITEKDPKWWPVGYFSTAVVQGRWVREAVAICAREGISIDGTQREIEPIFSPLGRKCLAQLRRLKRSILPARTM